MPSETSHTKGQAEQDLGAGDPNLPTLPTPTPGEEDMQDRRGALPIPVKLTGYLLFIVIVPIVLGVAKTVYSYRNQEQVVITTLDLMVGVIFAVICAFLAELKRQCPGIWPCFFDDDWVPLILKLAYRPAVFFLLSSLLYWCTFVPEIPTALRDSQDFHYLSWTTLFFQICWINTLIADMVLTFTTVIFGFLLGISAILVLVVHQPEMPPGRPHIMGKFCLLVVYLASLYAAVSNLAWLFVYKKLDPWHPIRVQVFHDVCVALLVATWSLAILGVPLVKFYVHKSIFGLFLQISIISGILLSYKTARDEGDRTWGRVTVATLLWVSLTTLPITWRGSIAIMSKVRKNMVRHWNEVWGYMLGA
ncbi:hypothetical protein BJV78DRAFT_1254644, partial [Lactifluus subvellereus]